MITLTTTQVERAVARCAKAARSDEERRALQLVYTTCGNALVVALMAELNPTPVKPKKLSQSRPARWGRACDTIMEVKSKFEDLQGELGDAIDEIKEVQQEYQDWLDNLPENLQQSALADKLNEVTNLDLDVEVDLGPLDVFEEAQATDLPLGFGRD